MPEENGRLELGRVQTFTLLLLGILIVVSWNSVDPWSLITEGAGLGRRGSSNELWDTCLTKEAV